MEESLNLELILKLAGKKYMIESKLLLLLSLKNISSPLGIFNIIRNWKISLKAGFSMTLSNKSNEWD